METTRPDTRGRRSAWPRPTPAGPSGFHCGPVADGRSAVPDVLTGPAWPVPVPPVLSSASAGPLAGPASGVDSPVIRAWIAAR